MSTKKGLLVLGASGRTGRHFVALALREGHHVRALVRDPAKLSRHGIGDPGLHVVRGDITDRPDLDALVSGLDAVVVMLGDVALQEHAAVNTAFVRELVPAMRRQAVSGLLYQAGALSRPPGGRLPPALWAIRKGVGRAYDGQHRDNETVMEHLVESADDLAWVVHRASIVSDGPSKGALVRSTGRPSVATFRDCATYNYQALFDPAAAHTCDLSRYARASPPT